MELLSVFVRRWHRRAGLLAVLALSTVAEAQPVVAVFERYFAHAQADAIAEGGLLLLNELNCVACHAPPAEWRERLRGRGRISLAGVGSRLAPETLHDFTRDPARVKPGTAMPRMATVDASGDDALVAYLQSFTAPAVTDPFPPGNKERGRHVYETVGCTACHAPADVATTYPSVPLALASHYDRRALAAFLRDPLATRPGGRMPATPLSDREAADLAEYLGAKDLPATPAIAPVAHSAGRAQFIARNCTACHETGEKLDPRAAAPLAQLRSGAGCLTDGRKLQSSEGGASSPPNFANGADKAAPSEGLAMRRSEPALAQPPSTAPQFGLSPMQIRSIETALEKLRATPAPQPPSQGEKVLAKFAQLNCYACHEWRGRGGIEESRAKHFVAADSATESLGELGRVPPSLDQAGRKLTEWWLENLLWGAGGGVRPYLSVRMPRFGRASSAELPEALTEACRPAQMLSIDTSGGLGHQRSATGRALMGTGTGGLGCVNCHGLKDQEPRGIRAINLTHTAARVRPEYFKALLLDPQHIQPGTIMPPLFAGRAGADKEIESIWTYLKELDQSPVLPEGLAVAGAFELKPAEEGRPIVFRTFLDGAGTQAIAVGTPVGAHAAFDAFEVRWALVWHGRFLDAQQTWEERAMKPVKPLGEGIIVLSNHMPFANLESPTSPWPAAFGARAGYAFKGYRIGADGVPTFRYSVGDLEVEDSLRPAPDGSAFHRRTVVRGTGNGWYFRGLAPGAEPQRIAWANGTAVFEETFSL